MPQLLPVRKNRLLTLHLFKSLFFYTDKDAVNDEVREIFRGKAAGPSVPRCSSSNMLARCDELLTKLRSEDPSCSSGKIRKLKRLKNHPARQSVLSKRKRNVPSTKRVVVLNYAGATKDEVIPLRDSDIIIDGYFSSDPFDDESDIRCQIKEMVKKKNRDDFDFTTISSLDMEFVRVANKKVRVPDGTVSFDASGIAKVYPHGAVYVRLTVDFEVSESSLC